MPGHGGVRWRFSVTRAHCVRRYLRGHRLVRAGNGSHGRHAGFIGFVRCDREIRRTIRAIRFNAVLCGLAGKNGWMSSASSMTSGWQLALCDGDPRTVRALRPALQLSRHRRQCESPRGTCPPRRDQSRDSILRIRPMSDLAQYGAEDVWSSPLVTLRQCAGDCEDYAIAKFVALRHAGISPDDLRIVIMHDTMRGEDHAVAAARLDGHWLMLGQSPHGDDRGCACQELPADLCHRSARRHAICRYALACGRGRNTTLRRRWH